MRSTEAVTGYSIEAVDGEIGHVDGFVLDDETWAIRYMEVATRNWWPGKKVFVSPSWIHQVSWTDSTVYKESEGTIMNKRSIQLALTLASVGIIATALSQSTIAQDASQTNRGSTQFRNSAVRILHPRAGQALANSYVTIRFELVRPNPAGGDNNFVIQLDGREPVKTSEGEFTFTGLRPGQHIITVIEVDANGTPLPDARAEVGFSVKSPEGSLPSTQSDRKTAPAK